MSAHDGGVDHHVFVVVITRQQLENTLENAALRPPTEALVDDLPIAKALREIAPRDTSSKSEENRLDEQSVIRRGASHMAFAAGQKILDPIPLIVAQSIASHPSAPSSGRLPMSHTITDLGIPPTLLPRHVLRLIRIRSRVKLGQLKTGPNPKRRARWQAGHFYFTEKIVAGNQTHIIQTKGVGIIICPSIIA